MPVDDDQFCIGYAGLSVGAVSFFALEGFEPNTHATCRWHVASTSANTGRYLYFHFLPEMKMQIESLILLPIYHQPRYSEIATPVCGLVRNDNEGSGLQRTFGARNDISNL